MTAPLPHEPPPSERVRPASSHVHIWMLADGTPVHAPPGRMTVNADGRLACHLCGRWFRHVGAHLRQHGWSADQYREAVGLPRYAPLCSEQLSARISVRQSKRFRADPGLRERLQTGIELARSGQLARRSVDQRHQDRLGTNERRRAALAAGRATRERRIQERLQRVLEDNNAGSLHDWLRRRYDAGASLESLRELTGLGRDRLRAEIAAAAVDVRPRGQNVLASKQRRASDNDRAVAEALGVVDLVGWLWQRRRAGATLAELAESTGRSIPWINSRLARSAAE